MKLKSAISIPKKDSLRNWRDRYSASKVLAQELGSRAENGEETMFSRSAPAMYPSSLASQTRLRSQNHSQKQKRIPPATQAKVTTNITLKTRE